MKYLLTALCLLMISAGCTAKPQPVTQVEVKEAQGLLANDFAVLVDVREAEEVKEGMAAPAQWMPLSLFETSLDKTTEKLPKNKQIIFYCASGARAQKAAEIMAAKGYKTSYFPGFDDWKAAGLPTKQPQ